VPALFFRVIPFLPWTSFPRIFPSNFSNPCTFSLSFARGPWIGISLTLADNIFSCVDDRRRAQDLPASNPVKFFSASDTHFAENLTLSNATMIDCAQMGRFVHSRHPASGKERTAEEA
jgi:hypothetical protein